MEHTWAEHTNTTDFVDELAIMVGGEYTTTDLLNTVVKQYMLHQCILCGAVHTVDSLKRGNLTKLLLRRQP